jgi:hypothetical protein
MPGNSVTVLLPYSTAVVAQSFANAAYVQRVTIQPQGGSPIVFSGSGFYDTPIGQQTLNTPSGTGSGFPVVVTVDHSSDGGQTWQPSQVDWVDCQVMYFALSTVVSEDATDNTWDDATTYFSWTEPPSPVLTQPQAQPEVQTVAEETRA